MQEGQAAVDYEATVTGGGEAQEFAGGAPGMEPVDGAIPGESVADGWTPEGPGADGTGAEYAEQQPAAEADPYEARFKGLQATVQQLVEQNRTLQQQVQQQQPVLTPGEQQAVSQISRRGSSTSSWRAGGS